jgi:integrase
VGVKVREKPKGSGIWYVFIEHQGKRKAKKVGSDKKLAMDIARKLGARLTLNDMKLLDEKESVPTFKEVAEQWLHGYIKTMRRPSTFERYEGILTKHVLPHLGQVAIDQVKRSDIRNLLLQKKGGLSDSMVRLIKDVCSGVCNHALDDELIESNPVIGITKRLQLGRDKEEVEPFTLDEMIALLNTAKLASPEFYPFFLLAFRTGLRLGELLGLEWGDVDFRERFLDVKRSYKNGRYARPKNGKSRRVDLSEQCLQALSSLRKQRVAEGLASGSGVVVETIFHRKGETVAQNSVRNVFNRMLLKAGVRKKRFHDIRHTYASMMLSNGESPQYVKEQMGHSSISITVDVYGHMIPTGNRDAVNALDAMAQPSATQPQLLETKNPQPVKIAGNCL